ncbi:MAG: hypothetical protein V4494_01190 [Chlamydiota bacterium]
MFTACAHHSRDNKSLRIKKFLSSLSQEEHLALSHFFRTLIQEDAAGYVLLGEKPLCFYSYLKPLPVVKPFSSAQNNVQLFFEGFESREILFHHGWEIWKKRGSQFYGKNIVFDCIDWIDDLHWMQILVINKNLILQTFKSHFEQFKKLDFSASTPELLVDSFLCNLSLKNDFFANHELLGIALGYGEKNARKFQTMCEILHKMGKLGFTINQPSSNNIAKLQREYESIHNSLSFLEDHQSHKFLFTLGVGCRVDFSDAESVFLEKKYRKLRKLLTQEYRQADFLTKTLELIVSANEPILK